MSRASDPYFGNQHQDSCGLTSFPILNRHEETKRGPNKSENRKVKLRVEPGEALSTAAQVAVALAGFAGVVVVFRRESVHEWSPIDKFRLRILLTNSILPLAFCMIGLLLLTIKPNPAGAWRWCSGLTFAVLFLFGIETMRIFRSFGDAVSIIQRCYPWCVLAVLHRNRRPTSRRHVPVCANHSSTAGTAYERSRLARGYVIEAVFTGRRKPRHIRYRELQIPLVRCREGGRNPR
jgi:hypothetical protein